MRVHIPITVYNGYVKGAQEYFQLLLILYCNRNKQAYRNCRRRLKWGRGIVQHQCRCIETTFSAIILGIYTVDGLAAEERKTHLVHFFFHRYNIIVYNIYYESNLFDNDIRILYYYVQTTRPLIDIECIRCSCGIRYFAKRGIPTLLVDAIIYNQ